MTHRNRAFAIALICKCQTDGSVNHKLKNKHVFRIIYLPDYDKRKFILLLVAFKLTKYIEKEPQKHTVKSCLSVPFMFTSNKIQKKSGQ